MICRSCKQNIPKKLIESRKADKAKRVSESLAKRKKEGLHVGRPIKVDANQVLALRDRGLSIRKIASILRLSTSTVQYALKRGSS